MFTCQNKGDYLFAEVNGPYSLGEFISAVHEVADHCRMENLNKAFVDMRHMEGDPSILERHPVGLEIAKVWGSCIKVAVIARKETISQMGENTAVNRGAKLMVTPDENPALEWLGLRKET